ncbi:trihelix transcription factor GT-2 isoform X1 [Solanum pennellii]|uniref:Trihelix transcription factor GT-2 isoform X1 n=1 Tax=Solanum pennellii TaxID=28526 RepID=A0ABM1FI43_SOLPN|nr:trihelix transcription factor GT-2 isoform X1 [Solanum pennellii]
MEPLIDGDGHPPNDITSFANNLAPFPESTNVVYENPSAVIAPPGIHRLPVSPVRKLRPVRFGNGRNYVDMVDSNCDIDEALMTCTSDLGFLSQFSAQNASTVLPMECGFVNSLDENGVAKCSEVGISAVQQMKSELDADCLNLISQSRILETEFSSSSDSESSEAIEEHLNRKRKRGTRKSLKLSLEDMVKKLMDKQEQMHKQLIEMLEKKEEERIIREEAWKQQEVERAKRDVELRAEETSRNLALIAFLENLLGEDFQIPKSSEVTSLVKDEGEVHGQEADVRSDPCNRRWPKLEVQALVSVRTRLDHKFLKGAKGSVWEEVANGLAKMGYIRTAKKCKEKWENINKYYKRTIDSGKTRPKNYRSCPYFYELDSLYKNGLLNQGAGNCVKIETENKNVDPEE